MIVYTDGACAQNAKSRGPGGYGVVVLDDNYNLITTYSHKEDNTTNNRQEMKAIIWATIHYGKHNLTIYSDSSYAIQTFETWMYSWYRNDWKKSDGRLPENMDLISAFHNLIQQGYKVKFEKVKGHSGNKWNEMADDLATGRAKAIWNMN